MRPRLSAITGPLGLSLPPFSATKTSPGATPDAACVTVRCGGVMPPSEWSVPALATGFGLAPPHAASARAAIEMSTTRTSVSMLTALADRGRSEHIHRECGFERTLERVERERLDEVRRRLELECVCTGRVDAREEDRDVA